MTSTGASGKAPNPTEKELRKKRIGKGKCSPDLVNELKKETTKRKKIKK